MVEARHDFEGIYQTAYQREVIEFICLLMRRDCKLYTCAATLPPVKTICSLLQSNPAFVFNHNQNPFVTSSGALCAFLWCGNSFHMCCFLFAFFYEWELASGISALCQCSYVKFLVEFNWYHLRTFYKHNQLSWNKELFFKLNSEAVARCSKRELICKEERLNYLIPGSHFSTPCQLK